MELSKRLNCIEDNAALRQEMQQNNAEINRRLDALNERMNVLTRWIIGSQIGTFTALTGRVPATVAANTLGRRLSQTEAADQTRALRRASRALKISSFSAFAASRKSP